MGRVKANIIIEPVCFSAGKVLKWQAFGQVGLVKIYGLPANTEMVAVKKLISECGKFAVASESIKEAAQKMIEDNEKE